MNYMYFTNSENYVIVISVTYSRYYFNIGLNIYFKGSIHGMSKPREKRY